MATDKNPDCPCTYPGCTRHGDCERCRAYHGANGEATACGYREKEVAK